MESNIHPFTGIQSKWYDNEVEKTEVTAVERSRGVRLRDSTIRGGFQRKRKTNFKVDVSCVGYRGTLNPIHRLIELKQELL